MSNFRGQVVLITGAASGFGALLAERLASHGADLVLGDLNVAGVEAVAAKLQGNAVAIECDVSSEKQVQAMVELGLETHGRVDIAINNAGISATMKSLVDTKEEELDRNFRVNAKGVFFGMKHQIPVMVAQGGGAILNVASVAGILGAPKLAPYAAAKHAVVGMTKTAAVEYARHNVRINAVCPFFSPTPMVRGHIDPQVLELVKSGVPMKRLAEPREIVNTMLHIVDPDNTYLTGQAIAIDGGVSAI